MDRSKFVDISTKYRVCPKCKGKGYIQYKMCPKCKSEGYIKYNQENNKLCIKK